MGVYNNSLQLFSLFPYSSVRKVFSSTISLALCVSMCIICWEAWWTPVPPVHYTLTAFPLAGSVLAAQSPTLVWPFCASTPLALTKPGAFLKSVLGLNHLSGVCLLIWRPVGPGSMVWSLYLWPSEYWLEKSPASGQPLFSLRLLSAYG